MAELTVNEVGTSGATETLVAAAAGGDTYVNNERTFVIIDNASGTTERVITVNAVKTTAFVPRVGEVTISNISLTVALSTRKVLFAPPGAYSSGGKATMTYSSEADLTVGAFKLARV
jgi:hypothetical protein